MKAESNHQHFCIYIQILSTSLKKKVRSILEERKLACLFLDEVQLVEGYGEALRL